MIKKSIGILILLLIVCAVVSKAQSSAQATMQVSVRIVSGYSVETVQPDFITIARENLSNLGRLVMKGIQSGNVILQNSDAITLRSKEGDEMMISILSQRERSTDDSESISYKGISMGGSINSVYRGELDTTVEYL